MRRRPRTGGALGRIWLAFPEAEISVRPDDGGYCARIDLPSRSWCSTRGRTVGRALANCLALALEPAPGFPGWVEPPSSLLARSPPAIDESGSF
jgi:hypothetical protein